MCIVRGVDYGVVVIDMCVVISYVYFCDMYGSNSSSRCK